MEILICYDLHLILMESKDWILGGNNQIGSILRIVVGVIIVKEKIYIIADFTFITSWL